MRADSRFERSQWETLQSNAISHWLGAILESALLYGRLIYQPDTPPANLGLHKKIHGEHTGVVEQTTVTISGGVSAY